MSRSPPPEPGGRPATRRIIFPGTSRALAAPTWKQFEDKIPPFTSLYFRGPVMWAFDGQTWKMSEFSPAGSLTYERAENPVRYTVTAEAHGKHWLFSLDVPGTIPAGAAE